MAAQQGYAPAQFNLGGMFSRQLSDDLDREEAMSWLEAAAAQGHRRASLELALLQAPPEPQVLEPVDAEEAAGADRDDQPSIVPIFEASPAASGLAIIAAAAFDDRDTLSSLLASVKATAFPTWQDGALLFAASNAVGDAAILFGLLRGADDTRGAHT